VWYNSGIIESWKKGGVMRRYEVQVTYHMDLDETKESPELLALFGDPNPVDDKCNDLIDAILDGPHQRQVKVKQLS